MRCVTASGVALLLLFVCGGLLAGEGEALTPTTHKGNNHNDDEDVLDKIHADGLREALRDDREEEARTRQTISGVSDAEESELEENCNRREDRYLRSQLARVKSLPPPIPMTQQQIKTEQREIRLGEIEAEKRAKDEAKMKTIRQLERELMEAASTFMRPLDIPQMQ
ncbi:unnamed protein product [Vitrella brassicaformis CCMP3155]|uniref:Uncharacterized protein n=1 Tax=Vitrella brassicaformis (strain CCMP3155) TaxID=1169540 RepID=A0A0G4ESD5_VITBC|nr:unnamed protein product [Vitrella brassicaformis CCMP3155]|eukprot:CEM01540.1 unnamed protein product [Vitrella brassicaformis CCMP3155]